METNFAEWLQVEMDQRGMNATDLSRAAHKDPAIISRILRQERTPASETCLAIATALKIPAEIVLRAAGHLPPLAPPRERQELWDYLFYTADPEDQETAITLLRALRERREAKTARGK